MRITRVEIKNYRNLDDIIVELDPYCNYIIGENNLGKSNFLDLLNIVCTGRSFEESDFLDQQLPIEVVLALKLDKGEWGFFNDNFSDDDPSMINIVYRQNISEAYPTVICLDTNEKIQTKQIRKLNYFQYQSTSSPSRELRLDTKKGMGMLMDGFIEKYLTINGQAKFINMNNIKEFIKYVNTNFSRIHGFKEFGIEADIATETSEIVMALLYLSDGERNLNTTGTGTQYIAMASIGILCFAMELFKSKKIPFNERLYTNEANELILPMILSIDEPEVHLHPFLQRSLIRFYKRILKNSDEDFKRLLKDCFEIDGVLGQIIIVTHSTDTLVGDYRNLIRFYKEDGKTKVVSGPSEKIKIKPEQEKQLVMRFPELKEAFYSHCAILIEGETEYGCINKLAEKLPIPLDDLGISVINARGEKSIKSLRRLLNMFKIPSVAIYDGDVKTGNSQTDTDFFTTAECFEEEIIKKLYDSGKQDLIKEIATDLHSKAMSEVVDKNLLNKFYKKKNISLDNFEPKQLGSVLDNDAEEFCNIYSGWYYAKKGVLLGRIIGEKLTLELIPESYANALRKAEEVAENAR